MIEKYLKLVEIDLDHATAQLARLKHQAPRLRSELKPLHESLTATHKALTTLRRGEEMKARRLEPTP